VKEEEKEEEEEDDDDDDEKEEKKEESDPSFLTSILRLYSSGLAGSWFKVKNVSQRLIIKPSRLQSFELK